MTRAQMMALLQSADLEQSLPEITRLKGVPQPQEFHAEGDAFIHTCLAVAALPSDADPRLVWATALHDIGKADTTRFVNGRWRAHGHDLRSCEMVPAILQRFEVTEYTEDVIWLVRHHLFASSWQPQKSARLTLRQQRFCRNPLFPLLILLCRADAAASHGKSHKIDHLQLILDQRERGDYDNNSTF